MCGYAIPYCSRCPKPLAQTTERTDICKYAQDGKGNCKKMWRFDLPEYCRPRMCKGCKDGVKAVKRDLRNRSRR